MSATNVQNLYNKFCALRDFLKKKIDEMAPEMESVSSEEVREEAKVHEDETPSSVGEISAELSPPKISTPPEPMATKARPGVRRGKNGGLNKSEIIRQYFLEHKDARNKDAIEYIKQKHKIKLQPSLVSTVRMSMGEKTKSSKKAASKSERSKKAHNDLPMTACCAEVLKGAKHGLKLHEVAEAIEKSGMYSYKGGKGEKGYLQTVYQGLHSLKKKKNHLGWKGKMPIVIHERDGHRYKLNPKAKRENVA